MGNKYSTVYQHNTHASYQSNNYNNNTESNLENIEDITSQLGNNCVLFDKYPGHLKCKLCYTTMFLEPTIMIKCGRFKHRYHEDCMTAFIRFADNRDVFKCSACRNILAKYFQ